MAKKEEERTVKDADAMLAQMRKKYGEGAVFHGGSSGVERIPRWKVSSPSISYVLGGGIPPRIIEIFGPESSGKTSLGVFLAGEVQRQGGTVLYADFENAYDPEYAPTLGLDKSRTYVSQPDSGEQGLDIIRDYCESGVVDYILVDSVAAITPEAEIEGDMGDKQMGAQAQLMGKALRKISALARANGITIVFLNQLREKIGVMYGNPETTPGGKALKFYASIRLDMRRKEYVVDSANKENYVGVISRIKAVKNKTAPPMRQAQVKIIFGQGFQYEMEYVDFAIEHGIIRKAGPWYYVQDTEGNEVTRSQGKAGIVSYMKENDGVFEGVKTRVDSIMNSQSEFSAEPEPGNSEPPAEGS